MYLIIVESPTKARRIRQILGDGFTMAATKGHIEDLAEDKLSVDIDGGYVPQYELLPHGEAVLSNIVALAERAQKVLLATDPDREGEFIAWSVWRHLPPDLRARCVRVKFYSITAPEVVSSVIEALSREGPGIDFDLVAAQQTRRVIDRLIGWGLGNCVLKQTGEVHSIGRVKSPMLRAIVDREISRETFRGKAWYEVVVTFDIMPAVGAAGKFFSASRRFNSLSDARAFARAFRGPARVTAIKTKTFRLPPNPPFSTSTLQQAAWRKYAMSASETMKSAQRLFEGGHITYPRTDSVYLSDEGVEMLRQYILRHYGRQFCRSEPYVARKTVRTEESHEAVRPCSTKALPSDVLVDDRRLFDMVFRRAVASQMADAVINAHTAEIEDSQGNRVYYTAWEEAFPGHLRCYGGLAMPRFIKKVGKGAVLPYYDVNVVERVPSPPDRHNDASLVRLMEDRGIGRPSTYASTLSALKDSQYVEFRYGFAGGYVPTRKARKLVEFLKARYPRIVDYAFTAYVESMLDRVAKGEMSQTEAVEEVITSLKDSGVDILTSTPVARQ